MSTSGDENGARANKEHQGNDGRRDDDGPADVAGRGTGFAGKNRNVFESAKRADREFAEDVETIKNRHRGRCDLQWVIFLQFAASEGEEGQNDQRTVNEKHGECADVVDPFAEGETAHATPAETEDECATYQGNTPFVVWHPALTERVGKVGGDEHSAESDDADGEQPQVPGDDEADELVEAEFGPLIKTSLQRHQAI